MKRLSQATLSFIDNSFVAVEYEAEVDELEYEFSATNRTNCLFLIMVNRYTWLVPGLDFELLNGKIKLREDIFDDTLSAEDNILIFSQPLVIQ
jgi:hypothetical protein